MTTAAPHQARCYCGAVHLMLSDAVQVVAACHCVDCRRWTGAPLPVFAAFADSDVLDQLGPARVINAGVRRWNCDACGSPLAAAFDYLPGQIYIPVGIIANPVVLPPDIACHVESALPWIHLEPGVPAETGSARDTLQAPIATRKDRS